MELSLSTSAMCNVQECKVTKTFAAVALEPHTKQRIPVFMPMDFVVSPWICEERLVSKHKSRVFLSKGELPF